MPFPALSPNCLRKRSRSGNDTMLGERITSEETRAKAVESFHSEQLDSLSQSKLNKNGDMMTGDLTVSSSGSIVLGQLYLLRNCLESPC
jgi:hypothetical protein